MILWRIQECGEKVEAIKQLNKYTAIFILYFANSLMALNDWLTHCFSFCKVNHGSKYEKKPDISRHFDTLLCIKDKKYDTPTHFFLPLLSKLVYWDAGKQN